LNKAKGNLVANFATVPMKDCIKYGYEGGKDFGCVADELTPQACYRSG